MPAVVFLIRLALFSFLALGRRRLMSADLASGVWNESGSPYRVTCNLVVPVGETLEIGAWICKCANDG